MAAPRLIGSSHFFSFGCNSVKQVVATKIQFSLVWSVSSIYKLNQSKLYLDRHICLSVCLWLLRYKRFWLSIKGKHRLKRNRMFFFFWLQVWLPINVPWAERRVAHGKVRPPCANKWKEWNLMKIENVWICFNRWFCFCVVPQLKA